MRMLEQCRMVDVLGEWGIHEGVGRWQLPVETFKDDDRLIQGVEQTLTRRSPLVWRIMAGLPIAALRVEIVPEDIPALRIMDGRTIDDWTAGVLEHEAESAAYLGKLANRTEVVTGPLTCSARKMDGDLLKVLPPIVIFDGCHRAAAWMMQVRRGADYPIAASLIVTQCQVPLLDG